MKGGGGTPLPPHLTFYIYMYTGPNVAPASRASLKIRHHPGGEVSPRSSLMLFMLNMSLYIQNIAKFCIAEKSGKKKNFFLKLEGSSFLNEICSFLLFLGFQFFDIFFRNFSKSNLHFFYIENLAQFFLQKFLFFGDEIFFQNSF